MISNWGVLQLPRVLAVNLGQNSTLVSAACILLPFVRTGMTDEYANNPRVFGRWHVPYEPPPSIDAKKGTGS